VVPKIFTDLNCDPEGYGNFFCQQDAQSL